MFVIYLDAVEIDESLLGGYVFNEDVEIVIGEGETHLTELLDSCIETMKEGEQAYIKTKINAKGQKVSDLELKKDNLKFNVTLSSLSRAADMDDLEPDEKLERGQHHKNRGGDLYSKQNYDFAIKRFNRALKYTLDDECDMTEIPESIVKDHNSLKLACFLNLGACYLKKEMYQEVIANCSLALEVEKSNVKGLFRRGQAYLKLHDYDNAKADLVRATDIEPSNKAILNQLKMVESLINKEKDMYKKMFSVTH